MSDNLSKLMGHIDYFFQNIPSLYDSDRQFEVYLKEKKWLITEKKSEQKFESDNYEDALNHLIEGNADLAVLHSLIYSNICTEGVLRRRQLKDVEELVGSEAIDKQQEGWDNFASGLRDMIEAINTERETAPTTGLSLVGEE